MTFALYGMGVSRGVAIGRVHLMAHSLLDVCERRIDASQVEIEIRRLDEAVQSASEQLYAVRTQVFEAAHSNIAEIIDAHLLMLSDTTFSLEQKQLIREKQCNAEWAVKLHRDALVQVFEGMDDPYLRTRIDDIDDVVNRILRSLMQMPLSYEATQHRSDAYIILADSFTPADMVMMQHGMVALITEHGGTTSHTAILARGLGMPAVVGLHGACQYIRDHDEVIVDGRHGVVLVEPTTVVRQHYEQCIQKEKRHLLALQRLGHRHAVTVDGESIKLMANIELSQDFSLVKQVGSEGVGLYRTEFLYMNRETPPDEETHLAAYVEVLEKLGGLPLTIRTLDIGADKSVDGGRMSGDVSNPALGLRAIRFCLRDIEMFKTQLRAIIRASGMGKVRLLLPMLSNVQEVFQILEMIRTIHEELDAQGYAYDSNMLVGGMIEVPAAAVCADLFAALLDFLSIGTNDLIQYTIAVDRVDETVNYLYDPCHPAVLRLIHGVIDAGERAGIPVSMCGEMAGETQYTPLLLALGLREFSLYPRALQEVKEVINSSDFARLREICPAVLAAKDSAEVTRLIHEFVV